jgi:3-oxoacyl-[acyl-carrier protein] reductase
MARRAVVSGGATGIGRAVAQAFAAAGDQVVLLGRRAELLERTAAELGAPASWHAADLTLPGEVAAAAAEIGRGGQVDVVVNNAGGNVGRDVAGDDADLDAVARAWRLDFEANVLTTVLLTRALLPLVTRPGGRILAIGSVAAVRGAGSYGAAKAALHAWAYDLATSLGPEGITVNVVAPGFIPDTEFWQGRLSDEVMRSRLDAIPVARPGTPEEVAAAVLHLASPAAGFTTGQVLGVNGGMVLGRG